MSTTQPPQLAVWFAESLISDPDLRDAALGDLAEDFDARAENGAGGAAQSWYWSQVLRSIVPLSMMSLRRSGVGGWVRLIATVVVGYVALAAMVIVSDSWMMDLSTNVWAVSLLSLGFGALSAVIAGYAAALIGGKTPMLAALSLGALCVGISVLMFAFMPGDDGSPFAYRVALMLIVLPSCAFGAMLRARQVSRASIRVKPQQHTRENER